MVLRTLIGLFVAAGLLIGAALASAGAQTDHEDAVTTTTTAGMGQEGHGGEPADESTGDGPGGLDSLPAEPAEPVPPADAEGSICQGESATLVGCDTETPYVESTPIGSAPTTASITTSAAAPSSVATADGGEGDASTTVVEDAPEMSDAVRAAMADGPLHVPAPPVAADTAPADGSITEGSMLPEGAENFDDGGDMIHLVEGSSAKFPAGVDADYSTDNVGIELSGEAILPEGFDGDPNADVIHIQLFG